MDEIKFVLKGLVIAIVLTLVLQIRMGNETLEMKSDRLLHHSSVGQFLNQSASGAALILHKGTQGMSKMASGVFGESKKKEAPDSNWKIQTRHEVLKSHRFERRSEASVMPKKEDSEPIDSESSDNQKINQ